MNKIPLNMINKKCIDATVFRTIAINKKVNKKSGFSRLLRSVMGCFWIIFIGDYIIKNLI